MPLDFKYELNIQKSHGAKIIVGIDEVGRGPLAGPVTAGAFVFCDNKKGVIPSQLKDSKLLNEKQREELFSYFKELKEQDKADFATASVFPRTIDKKQIHHAVVIAMRRAVSKLAIEPDYAFIDGFRYPKSILKNTQYASFPKADNRVASVAAASIVAKVTRDKSMKRYHKKYPEYGFDMHKGYGTELHYKMLEKYGPTPIHRRSFRLE